MLRKILTVTSLCLLAALRLASASEIVFLPGDRVLVVAAHPDDETLGAAGAIQRAKNSGAQVKLLYLTHGDQNELASIVYQKRPLIRKEDFLKSGRIREEEAVRAMQILGLERSDLIFLGYPDFGTLAIWKKHWGSMKPYRSFLTRMDRVLYKEDLSYGNYYKGENIVSDFEKVLKDYKPNKIFVTAPYDLNSDHQAAFLFLKVALLNLKEEMESFPLIYTYLVHYRHWPKPRKADSKAKLEVPENMRKSGQENWLTLELQDSEIDRKYQALLEYKSQMAYSKKFLSSFVRANEIFYSHKNEKIPTIDQIPSKEALDQIAGADRDVHTFIYKNELLIDMQLTDPWDRMGVLNLDIFSYSFDEAFHSMPKMRLTLFGGKLKVKKGIFRMSSAGIVHSIHKNRIAIRVPLEFLENPDYVFLSAITAREELSFDFGSWRVFKIN